MTQVRATKHRQGGKFSYSPKCQISNTGYFLWNILSKVESPNWNLYSDLQTSVEQASKIENLSTKTKILDRGFLNFFAAREPFNSNINSTDPNNTDFPLYFFFETIQIGLFIPELSTNRTHYV